MEELEIVWCVFYTTPIFGKFWCFSERKYIPATASVCNAGCLISAVMQEYYLYWKLSDIDYVEYLL